MKLRVEWKAFYLKFEFRTINLSCNGAHLPIHYMLEHVFCCQSARHMGIAANLNGRIVEMRHHEVAFEERSSD